MLAVLLGFFSRQLVASQKHRELAWNCRAA